MNQVKLWRFSVKMRNSRKRLIFYAPSDCGNAAVAMEKFGALVSRDTKILASNGAEVELISDEIEDISISYRFF